jgi:hypothetical protein
MVECVKVGEIPSSGTLSSSRVSSLIGPDRDLFLKGRECEVHGHGIGAFTYYRRVVENQKNRIIDEIIRVSKRQSSSPEMISELENAKKETQFKKAVDKIKAGIPRSLWIKENNPLTLLHRALSVGVHELDDAECLTYATSVREVLGELAARISQALKDEKALENAVNILAGIRNKTNATE